MPITTKVPQLNALPRQFLNYTDGSGGMHIPQPGKALLNKSLIQPGGISEFLTILPSKWGGAKGFEGPGPGHARDCSPVLRARQAECYGLRVLSSCSTLLHDGHNGGMETAQHQPQDQQQSVQPTLETNDERRRRLLIELCKREGKGDINRGREEVARCAGVNSDYLRQIIAGTLTPTRTKMRQVGDDMARAIEVGLGLPRGWMDNGPSPGMRELAIGPQLTINSVFIAGRQLATICDQLQEPMSHGEFVDILEAYVDDSSEHLRAESADTAAKQFIAGVRYAARRHRTK